MTIKDIPSDVVAEMLLYIYTGNTPNLNKLAGDLLGAAEQYQLEMLKNICEEKLCNSLEIDNSVNHLILGDLYRVLIASNLVSSSLSLLPGPQSQEDVLAVRGEEHEHRGPEQGLERVAHQVPGPHGGGDGGHGQEGSRGGFLQESWSVSVRRDQEV